MVIFVSNVATVSIATVSIATVPIATVPIATVPGRRGCQEWPHSRKGKKGPSPTKILKTQQPVSMYSKKNSFSHLIF